MTHLLKMIKISYTSKPAYCEWSMMRYKKEIIDLFFSLGLFYLFLLALKWQHNDIIGKIQKKRNFEKLKLMKAKCELKMIVVFRNIQNIEGVFGDFRRQISYKKIYMFSQHLHTNYTFTIKHLQKSQKYEIGINYCCIRLYCIYTALNVYLTTNVQIGRNHILMTRIVDLMWKIKIYVLLISISQRYLNIFGISFDFD